ncbi:hypothetical protein HYC85_005185 [Camellia sinensis]|uniref:Uncharacterized protein n=1 Tax=Camellia sinensis TaxID=4442 RepID=A0A7J7HYR2_CAMSI|nr:hypothetical protein HYC85_005185 [Camellia sinensis]
MSWSRVFRLPQIYMHVHHSSPGYRCSLDSSWLTRNFVGPNSTRNGWDFSYEFRGVMTRCESSVGSFRKCGQLTPCLDVWRQYATHAAREHKSKKMLLYLTGLVFAMVGCTYAAVPLYRRFCQATGYGGTVQRREVRVKAGESALAFYTAENQSSTPITGVSTYNVTPMKSLRFGLRGCQGGDWRRWAMDTSNYSWCKPLTFSPGKDFWIPLDLQGSWFSAAVYFNKIQCFCFEEQRLLPGEQIDMPVFFYIDPEFETDPKMDGINNLILSYTFFKVSEE